MAPTTYSHMHVVYKGIFWDLLKAGLKGMIYKFCPLLGLKFHTRHAYSEICKILVPQKFLFVWYCMAEGENFAYSVGF